MQNLPAGLTLRQASFDEVDSRTFYRIAKLRQEIFVVEQNCVYLDLDGRDLEPETQQLWAEDEHGAIASSVRILAEDADEPNLRSIGRVVTAQEWRGRGIAGAVMRAAVAACEGHPIILHAQSHLLAWYAGFGFAAYGEEYLEDGIPHTSMRRDPVS